MKIKENLKLRKVGDRYMLVDVSDTDANVTTVYTFNDTAAFVWNEAVNHGLETGRLAGRLCEEYDVSPDAALADVNRLLAIWRRSGLLG